MARTGLVKTGAEPAGRRAAGHRRKVLDLNPLPGRWQKLLDYRPNTRLDLSEQAPNRLMLLPADWVWVRHRNQQRRGSSGRLGPEPRD
jgi:hypothetical protein